MAVCEPESDEGESRAVHIVSVKINNVSGNLFPLKTLDFLYQIKGNNSCITLVLSSKGTNHQ